MYFSVSLHITIYSLLNNFTHFTKGFWLLNRAVLPEQMQITIYNTFLILILTSNGVSLLLLILRLHLDLKNEDSPYKLRVFTLSKSCIHCLDLEDVRSRHSPYAEQIQIPTEDRHLEFLNNCVLPDTLKDHVWDDGTACVTSSYLHFFPNKMKRRKKQKMKANSIYCLKTFQLCSRSKF